jgi:hypothetical protein
VQRLDVEGRPVGNPGKRRCLNAVKPQKENLIGVFTALRAEKKVRGRNRSNFRDWYGILNFRVRGLRGPGLLVDLGVFRKSAADSKTGATTKKKKLGQTSTTTERDPTYVT